MNLYQITYTCLDTWLERQQTITKSHQLQAECESAAAEWFEEHVQMDYNDIELLEAAQ